MDMLSSSYFLSHNNLQTCAVVAFVWLLITIVLRKYHSRKRNRNLPPGPPSWPIVGSLPYLGTDIREPLRKLSETYGPIITVHLGGMPVVVLNSYDVIKEAFSQHIFAGRPYNFVIEKYMTHGYGLIESEGKLWQEHRRFTLSNLRKFGMGKSILESKIQEECKIFLDAMSKKANIGYDPSKLIETVTFNIISSITVGTRADYGDSALAERIDALQRSSYQAYLSFVVPGFKWLIRVPFVDIFGFWACMKANEKVKDDLDKHYVEHMHNLQPGVTRDLMEAYLQEMPKHKDEVDNTFIAPQVHCVISDLFAAGSDTTSNTLRWAILYMLHYPKVQQRIQQEIDDVIGRQTVPAMSDRHKLVYTEATISEILRVASAVPLAVPHQTLEDVDFHGYTIPKSTYVLANLHAVHYDPALWTEPQKFLPDRFLKDNEHPTKNKCDFLIPFSLGKRACIGESLAKMELFIMFTSLLQRFTFQPPEGTPLPSLTGTLGTTLFPDRYNAIFEPRI